MFGLIKNLFGVITVKEDVLNNIITIDGIPADFVKDLIQKFIKLKKINRNLFLDSSGAYTLDFYSFFAIEVVYLLKEISAQENNSYRAKRIIDNILREMDKNTWMVNVIKTDIPSIIDLSLLKKIKWELKPHQLEFLQRFGDIVPRYELKGLLLASPPGTGKALTLNTLIKIPGGWKTMGEMKVGDSVIAQDGTTTKVIGVYPQGVTPIYRIRFRDGRFVDTNGEHLWKCFSKNATLSQQWSIRNTFEIQRLLLRSSSRIYIPLCLPEPLPEAVLPIDPYILGYIIGNGGLTGGVPIISTTDKVVIDEIRNALPSTLKIEHRGGYDYSITRKENVGPNEYWESLTNLGLTKKYAHEKFIPEIYLMGSIEQRFALLQGLMDSDGTADKSGSCSFCSSSEILAKQVQSLIHSLGGIAAIAERHPWYTYKGIRQQGRTAYQVNIRFKTPSKLFRLRRKEVRVSDFNQYSDGLKLRVVSVERIADAPTQCIAVDHPDKLFVIQNHIVTHNTVMDLAVAATVIPQEIAEVKIIISPKNAIELVWEDTINKVFVEKPSDWVSNVSGPAPEGKEYYVFHYEALDRALELCKTLVQKGIKYFTIIDESHNFNEIGSKRTQLLIELCLLGGGYSVWASGSPLKKSKLEMIPLLRSIDPKFTESVEFAFKKIYGGDEDAASSIMYHRLGFYSYKIDKTVVVKEKATPIKIQVKLKDATKYLLTSIQTEMKLFIEARLKEIKTDIGKYHTAFDECIEEHRKTLKTDAEKKAFREYQIWLDRAKSMTMYTRTDELFAQALQFCKKYETNTLIPSLSKDSQKKFKECRSIVKSLVLKIRGEALGKIVTKRRAECAAELALNCNLENIIAKGIAKTMVFSTYVEPLDIATKYLTDKGFTTANVYGDTAKQVTQIVRSFHDDENINPILATFASLSTAVPVLAANQVVFLDIPFRNHTADQALSRCLRLGQTNPVFLYSIVLDTGDEPNISTRAGEILAACQKEIAACLGKEFGGIQEAEFDIEHVEEIEDVNINDTIIRVESTMS